MSDNGGQVDQTERDRAHRLGTIAAKAGRGLGGACPYNANGTPREKLLAMVFVRAYVRGGGQVDGLDYGDGSKPTGAPAPTTPIPTSVPTTPRSHRAGRGRHATSYGHLGYPL